MTHLLFSQEQDISIAWFDRFDAAAIKERTIKHLQKFPNDTVEHLKEYSKKDIKKYYGYQIINFYEVNPKNGLPSLVITKGDKTFYRKLSI